MAKVCDCFPELKATTDARESRYRAHPEKAAPEGPQSMVEVKVTSIGQLNELVETKKSGHKFIISEPVHVGGQNCAPTPLEFLLSGAVGCYAAVFAFYAAKMGISYDSFEAVARTNFDVRGHMMPDAPPSGFQKVTIEINVRKRRAGGHAQGGRASGARRLPGHRHAARSGAGRVAAQGHAYGRPRRPLNCGRVLHPRNDAAQTHRATVCAASPTGSAARQPGLACSPP